jgi:hypothetical protein
MYVRKLIFILPIIFFSATNAQIIKTKKPVTHSNGYYKWQYTTVGANYAGWGNGNHQGIRYQAQYTQSVSKYFSGSITAWHAYGVEKIDFVLNTPSGAIVKKRYSWAYALEPTIGASLFKNKTHDLTFFAGVVGGIFKTAIYALDSDVFLDPGLGLGLHPVVQRAKPTIMVGTNARLQYRLTLGRFVIAANLAGLSLDTGPYQSYHGVHLGYMLNKPLVKKLPKWVTDIYSKKE